MLPGYWLTRSRSRRSPIPCAGSHRQQRAPALTACPRHATVLPGHLAQGTVPLGARGGQAGDTCYTNLPKDPHGEANVCLGFFFFMDLQIMLYSSAVSLWSAFLAQDQGPAPAASVTHAGRRRRSGRGRMAQAGMRMPRLFRVRCLQRQLFLLVGGRVEPAAPLHGSSCPAPHHRTPSRLLALPPITHTRSGSELPTRLPALCPPCFPA